MIADKYSQMITDARVRFAPSPTGFLHIGSARTALFNWFFARHNKGKFLLRIEDTDLARSKKEYLDEILESLKWLGLDWDDEPVHQSSRLDIYKALAEKLLKEEKAYKAENGAIILRMPKEKIIINDLVHGRIEFDCGLIKDQVLIKADGTPTYNFACVIDDYDMKISHVIRGADHISNTPKQIVIYQSLGLKPPEFAHIPLILGKDKSRMSKRHGAVSIAEYKKDGFLSEALINFISLLGWAPSKTKEIMALNEIIDEFSLDRITKANAVFDVEKLKWMNGEYIKALGAEKLLERLAPDFKEKGWKIEDKKWAVEVVGLFTTRIRTLKDFFELADFFFMDNFTYNPEAVQKRLKNKNALSVLENVRKRFSEIDEFSAEAAENACRQLADEMKIKAADIIHPVRVAVSGKLLGPGLFEMLPLIGKDRVLKRLEEAKKLI